jgi:hypothetical protein
MASSPDALHRLHAMTPDDQAKMESLTIVDGLQFGNGTTDAEIAGMPSPDAPESARGFVGVAFRVQPDLRTYDAFYLRPTNGRADDQERRNHSAQYVSHPGRHAVAASLIHPPPRSRPDGMPGPPPA